jgi:tetratricopeptide (TPR) repeat protein
MSRWLARLLPALLLAATFALAVTRIDDSDAWTHLAHGREIVQRGALPANEPFSFPSTTMPYHNTEWLFDVLLYLAFLAAGYAGVTLLKALVVTLAFWVLWRDANLPLEPAAGAGVRAAGALLALWLVLFVIKPRFVERPDIVLMVFLPLTIYALDAYRLQGRRRCLYALPAVQVLWVNIHPSAIVAAVPLGAFLVGGGALHALRRWRGVDVAGTPGPRELRTVAAVGAGMLVASVLNPHGLEALTLPLRLTGGSWFSREVAELQAPTFADNPAPFVIVSLLTLALAAGVRRLPLIELVLVAPFAYLGLTANRFVFLLAIVAAPVIARALAQALAPLAAVRARPIGEALGIGVAAAGIVLSALALAQRGPFADPRKIAGIGVNQRFVPEGALRYLDRAGLEGRVFTVLHLGGYIEWRDFPRRVPIIDGRGYVPPGLLDEIHFARLYTGHLDRLRRTYGFDVAVVDYPAYAGDSIEDMAADVDVALASPDFALVYWDDVALVYVRRAAAPAGLLERDEYRHVRPANGTIALRHTLAGGRLLPAVERELRRNIEATDSSIGWALLGFAFVDTREWDRAIAAFAHVRDDRLLLAAYQGLAEARAGQGRAADALREYRRALELGESAKLLWLAGRTAMDAGDAAEATRLLERGRSLDPTFAPIYPLLVDAYRRRGEPARADALGTDFLAAMSATRARAYLRDAGRLAADGRLEEAVARARAALELEPRSARAHGELGQLYFAMGRLDEALVEQQSALRADPTFARAHYSLAEVYRRRGDAAAARRQLETYARLEPRSYAAWRIREELRGSGR